MTTKSYTQIQYEKMEQTLALIEVMRSAAESLEVSFDELSNLIDIPHNRPEFSDYIKSLDCQRTYFEPRNNELWYESEDNSKTKQIQSFQLFEIVLFRPAISSEETVWIPLNNLPCSANNAALVNDLFQQAAENKTEVNTATLRSLIDFNKLNSDTSLEWRRCMRSLNNNNDSLAVKILDEVHLTPKQIIMLQKKLSNLVQIIDTIRPQNHLKTPRELSINQPPREDHYERSSSHPSITPSSDAVRSTK